MENNENAVGLLNFSNPGEIDIRLVTTMGVNATEGGIGQFGTGLKYAIAGVLRLGGRIVVWSGETRLDFLTVPQTIKGKEFDFIEMVVDEPRNKLAPRSHVLGFTTELGKHWEPWMLYREFFANSRDAGGQGLAEARISSTQGVGGFDENIGTPGETNVTVQCSELWEVHASREEFFIAATEQMLWSGHGVEIFASPYDTPSGIFYQGIRIATEASAVFRYNLTEKVKLTEDRTLRNEYEAWTIVGKALVRAEGTNGTEILEQVLVPGTKESSLDFDWYSSAPASPEFVNAALRVVRNLDNDSIESVLKRYAPEKLRDAKLSIPGPEASFAELVAAAPEDISEVPSSPNFWAYCSEMETLLAAARKRGDYWMAVAARALRAEPEVQEDSEWKEIKRLDNIPF